MPCSTESSRPLRSRSSPTLNVAWSVAPWRSILTWMKLVFAGLALACAIGCSRTVLVPEGSPIRIGPDASLRVYVLTNGEWTLSSETVDVPEGWYVVPPGYVEVDDGR